MITNLRDVAETVNCLIGEEIMIEGRLYRGGTINDLFDRSELPDVKTVVNLRTGEDKTFEGIANIHIPAIDSIENYCTDNHQVKNWSNRVLSALNNAALFPILIHCTAGKDRTGVIVALILKCIGIEESVIVDEYLQSEGVKGPQNIITALEGFDSLEEYVYDQQIIDCLKQQLLVKIS